MFSIAVCDDEERDLKITLELLNEYDSNKSKMFAVTTFTTAMDLFQGTKETVFDLAILDIEMNSLNGYEVARQLTSTESCPLIIFLTKSPEYAIQGYGVAFRYITKPVDRHTFFAALDDAISEISASRFIFSIGGEQRIWKYADIYYFETWNHYVVLHTVDEEFTMRTALKDILPLLPQGYFCTPHHSYIVNCSHIKSADRQNVRLTNGIHIPISRGCRMKFENQLHTYLGRI